MSREKVYVCTRVADGPSHVIAMRRECSECKEPVWSSVRMMRDPQIAAMKVLCVQCAYPDGLPTPIDLIKGVQSGDITLHPIAMDEVRRHNEGEQEDQGHD